MKLVIAEKASQGRAYALALGADKKHDGSIEGNGYVITWCVGHLVELANADVYDEKYKKWCLEDLPIIPRKWEYVVSDGKAKQFTVVKKLMNDKRFTEVVIATDCGREGELIGRLVYEKAGCKLPIKRLWISSMETQAIIDGFNNLRDGAEFDNLYQSALCRSKADWVVGISATRAFTKLYNKKLNVGRVQTPTLAMLAERSAAIEGFVKEKYHNVRLNDVAVSEKITEQSQAEKIKTECEKSTATVVSVKREHKTTNPPKLHDLTLLQREANRLYGFTAQQTLDYAQSLYEMSLLTYPRTSSQYLPDDMADTADEIIKCVIETVPIYKELTFSLNVSRVINQKFVNDHFAICPTAEIAKVNLDGLPDGERKILLLVCNKLLCATADKHEYEAVTAEIECGGHTFTAKGKTVLKDGWKAVEWLFTGKEAEETPLDLVEGQMFENPVCTITEGFTKPKPHYTEDTLLSAMNTAGADEISEDVESAGLGTPATRAGIIEKLIKSGFIKRDKKNIVVTPDGAELISIMPDIIKSAKLTAEWENALSLIAKGEFSADFFMQKIEQLTNEIITQAKANVNHDKVAKYSNSLNKGDKIGTCPRCKNGEVCETPKAYSCDCGFALWKSNKFFESAKKDFTKEIATALINNGKTVVNGLYSTKTDKTYNATVCLDDTGTWVNFKLEFKKKS